MGQRIHSVLCRDVLLMCLLQYVQAMHPQPRAVPGLTPDIRSSMANRLFVSRGKCDVTLHISTLEKLPGARLLSSSDRDACQAS
jgi:hypothetical protein